MNGFRQWIASGALFAALMASAFATPGEPGFSRSVTLGLMDYFSRLFGSGARGRLQGWKDFVQSTASRAGQARANPGEAEPLRPVNGFFNRQPFVEDQAQWGVEDYWATPSEFLSSGGGDCEDYAIAKYFTLKELGVPAAKLRLVYVRTWQPGAHMVLAYYPSPGADPLILDNQQGSIENASARPDLTAVYLFNDDDMEIVVAGASAVHVDARSMRKWREVQDKLARELTL